MSQRFMERPYAGSWSLPQRANPKGNSPSQLTPTASNLNKPLGISERALP